MSPVSACASKCSIDTLPKPWCRATPVASGSAMVWSPPSTRGTAPGRRSPCARPPPARAIERSTSPEYISTSPASTDPDVLQRVDAQREVRPRAVVRQVAGLPDRHRPEPGARPVRRAAVERCAHDHHVGAGVGRPGRSASQRVDAEERDVRAVLRAVAASSAVHRPFGHVAGDQVGLHRVVHASVARSGSRCGRRRRGVTSTPESSCLASASAHTSGVAGSRVVPTTMIGAAPSAWIGAGGLPVCTGQLRTARQAVGEDRAEGRRGLLEPRDVRRHLGARHRRRRGRGS